MEFVDGEDLSQRLARGPMLVDEAVAIARQIIDALEAAHAAGIVHRDLKPANVKIRPDGTVKVLDFGLAKAVETAPGAVGDLANSPTLTAHLTTAGVILGTAAYMAPEQAKGRAVDARADIWAFGVVLYEMLAGRQPFSGETTQDVLAAVLTRETDWARLPPTTPDNLLRLLRRCLQRDPARRLRHIADARLELDEPAPISPIGASADGVQPTRRWQLAAAIIAIIVAVALAARAIMRPPAANSASGAPLIFAMSELVEPLYLFAGPVALSPDGTRVALVTNGSDGKPRIWLRALDSATPEVLEGADGGMNPFWSPDSRALGFFVNNELKVIDVVSRTIRTLAPWAGLAGGGTWNRDGIILFADETGLKRVAASGSEVSQVTTAAQTATGPEIQYAPQFLPDGRHYIFFSGNFVSTGGAIVVGSLDSPSTKHLVNTPTMAIYADPGYLLYNRSGELVAQAFDASRLSVEGDPMVLGSGVWGWNSGGMAPMSASKTGVLLYATRRTTTTQLRWFDRSGRPTGTLGEQGEWIHVEVSPDERTVAAERLDPRTGIGTIWTIDIARNVPVRLTPDPVWYLAPVWSPDSRRLAFAASRDGASNLFAKLADGSGPDEPLYRSNELKAPTDWTRDGRVVFNANGDIKSVEVGADHKVLSLLKGSWNEASGKVSADGRWLAYMSNESGRPEVYVRAVDGGGRWQISRSGGWQPRWRRDGKELFFLSMDSTLTAARVTTTSSVFSAGEPETLPIKVAPDVTGWRYGYDVVAQGQRFVVANPVGKDLTPSLMAIVNWTKLIGRQK